MVIPKRMTAEMEGSFCVFLIGMRINRPLRFHKWLPVFFCHAPHAGGASSPARTWFYGRSCLAWQDDITSSVLEILWGSHSIRAAV